jgi:hypothetical protein
VKVMVIYRVNEMVFYLQVQELIIKIGSIIWAKLEVIQFKIRIQKMIRVNTQLIETLFPLIINHKTLPLILKKKFFRLLKPIKKSFKRDLKSLKTKKIQ